MEENTKAGQDTEEKYHIYFDDNVPEIEKDEAKFWKKKIRRYLKPLEKDAQKEEEVQNELIELRNKVCLFVYLLNAILVTIMFGLTQSQYLPRVFNN